MRNLQEISTEDVQLNIEMEKPSEEVSDIIERIPIGWTKLVLSVMTATMLVILSLGFVIEYPDTVAGQISITGEKAPVRMVATSSGRLHLLVENHAEIREGTCLGYIETGTSYEDLMKLEKICASAPTPNTYIELPTQLKLGELSGYYNDYVLAYTQYDQIRRTKVYDNMRRTLRNQQASDLKVSDNLKREISLHEKALCNMTEQYDADSILYGLGAMSAENFAQQQNNLLSAQRSNLELKSSELQKLSEIHSVDIELAKVDVKVREELTSSFHSMIAKYNVLTNQIRQWKELHLFLAPMAGKLQYLGFWRDNLFVQNSTEVFSILPQKNKMLGELIIPSSGAGKVSLGQDVNVKLSDYPYDEYGYVRGRVESLSTLTRNVESREGLVKAYLVVVSFPEGLRTNFGKDLSLNFESIGTGEVITEKRRLIQRLFDNLKAKGTK